MGFGGLGLVGVGAGGVGAGGRGSCGGLCTPQAKKIVPHQAPSWLRAGLSAGPQPSFVVGQKERLRAESDHDGERAVAWRYVCGLAPSLGPFGRV